MAAQPLAIVMAMATMMAKQRSRRDRKRLPSLPTLSWVGQHSAAHIPLNVVDHEHPDMKHGSTQNATRIYHIGKRQGSLYVAIIIL